MEIKFKTDDFLKEEHIKKLKKTLKEMDGDPLSEQELRKKLVMVSKAALNEYMDMILGINLPTKANEFRERKLFHLMHFYFKKRFPQESEILSMFQLTESGSRTLLRNVRAKFKYELEEVINNSVKKILEKPKKSGDNYRFIIRSENILEEIKQVVSVEAPELDQIQKVKNSAGVYTIPPDTYSKLCDHYSLSFTSLTEQANNES